MKKAIYLKVNRNTKYAIKALQRWLDCAYYLNTIENDEGLPNDWVIKIICDNDILENKISKCCVYPPECRVSVIKSSDSAEVGDAAREICAAKWLKAGIAHLTTFEDANNNNYTEFFNIDADDTVLAVTTEHMAYMLEEIRKRANEKKYDLFSLDMWMSEKRGKHWTFGITYTKNDANYMNIIEKHCNDPQYKARRKNGYGYNVDDYFTYLKLIDEVNAESFYFENLRFIHYSDDFFSNPTASSFYHYKNRTIMKPIEYYCFGMHDIGKIDIWDEVIKLECGEISDVESQRELCKWAEKYDHYRFNKWPVSYNTEKLIDKKIYKFVNAETSETVTVVFGIGGCFKRHEVKIKKIPNLIGYVDNNPDLWGKEIDEKRVFSPEELYEISQEKQVNVLVTVENENVQSNISCQLKTMGTFSILYIDEYLRLFEDAEEVN